MPYVCVRPFPRAQMGPSQPGARGLCRYAGQARSSRRSSPSSTALTAANTPHRPDKTTEDTLPALTSLRYLLSFRHLLQLKRRIQRDTQRGDQFLSGRRLARIEQPLQHQTVADRDQE